MYQSFQDPKGTSTNKNSQNDYYSHQDAELSYQYQHVSSHSAAENRYNDLKNATAEISVNKNRSRSCIPFAAIATTVLFVVLLPGIIINNMKSSNIISDLNMISTTSSTGIASSFFSPSSIYSISTSVISPGYESLPLASLSLLPWDVIAEPARVQILSLTSMTIDDQIVDITPYAKSIVWTIQPGSSSGTNKYKSSKGGDVMTLYGNDQKFQIDNTGVRTYSVSITLPTFARVSNTASNNAENGVDKEVTTKTFTQEFTMAVKYVRRELRALIESDRSQFLEALYALYTVSATDGHAKYGSKFNTAEYFVYKHLNGAGTSDCDHWHDGAGIVTHHVAFTLEVEQALQAVNPAVAMPYWEYSMDSYLYANWWESPVFDKDWFGEATPSNSDHIVKDGGRWEGVLMPDGANYKGADFWSMKETGSLNPFVNAYGILRSPWNNNPSQAIGRTNMTYSRSQYTAMPTCKTMYSCFMSESASDMNDCLNGGTHGPVHIMIGGSWNEGDSFDVEGTDSKYGSLSLVHNADKLLFFKVLWRMGFTRCPTNCTGTSDCKCAVPQEYIDKYGAYYILEKANIIYGVADALVDADDEVYTSLLHAVEDPGVAGEMFSSAAAFDPTFWPLHGAMERMVGLKRILVSQGDVTDFDASWGFKEYDRSTKAAYLNGVCDWSGVSSVEDLTLPNCTMDVICYGHNEDDILEFSGFLSSGTSEEEEIDVYTNAEFLNFIHPWNDELPYTYDTFDYDYCLENGGFDFFASATSSTSFTKSTTRKGDVTNGSTAAGATTTASSSVTSSVSAKIIDSEPVLVLGSHEKENGNTLLDSSSSGSSTSSTTEKEKDNRKSKNQDTLSVSTTTTTTPHISNIKNTKSGRYTYKGFAPGQSQPVVKRVHMTVAEAHKVTTQPVAVTQKWQQVSAAGLPLHSSPGNKKSSSATATNTDDKKSSSLSSASAAHASPQKGSAKADSHTMKNDKMDQA